MITQISFTELDSILDEGLKLCKICENSFIQIRYPCQNNICGACLKEHIINQIQKYNNKYLSDKILFTCPGICKCEIPNYEVLKYMDKESLSKYNATLTKMLLAKQPDTLNCPNSSCTNIGFTDSYCEKDYECNFCGFKWKNKHNVEERLKKFINFFSFENLKSILKVFVLTKSCNNCGTKIEKNKGCKHMECFRCEHSFCWRCTGDWKTHNEYACMGLYTNIYDERFRPEFMDVVLFLFIVIVVFKIFFSFTILLTILWWIVYLMVFVGMLVFNCFILVGALNLLYECEKKKIIKSGLLIGLLFFEEYILQKYNIHPYSQRIFCSIELISLIITALVYNVIKLCWKVRRSRNIHVE